MIECVFEGSRTDLSVGHGPQNSSVTIKDKRKFFARDDFLSDGRKYGKK